MDLKLTLNSIHMPRNMTKLKLSLLISFSLLMLFQFLVGFKDFEDYLIVFIYALFLNDLYFKIKYPDLIYNNGDGLKRMVMSLIFFVLLTLPLLLDTFNVSNSTRLLLYKLGFVLWAQVLLLDSYLQYNQTQSKRWLVFTNTAAIMIIVGAFVG